MSKSIFVSHAEKDKSIVDAFVDLLQTGANLTTDQIFCTSLEGLNIPAGVNFIDHIKGEIQTPELVIAIITKNYLASQFCLCELGATWAMSHQMFPLIVPPIEFSDVKGVLTATQLVRLDDENGLNHLAEKIDEVSSKKTVKYPRWQSKQKIFLLKLPTLLEKAGQPDVATPEEFKNTIKKLEQTNTALEETIEENTQLQAKIEKLKMCKDAEEVQDVESLFSSSEEQLNVLIKNVSDQLKIFDRAVTFVTFRHFGKEEKAIINYYKDSDTLDYAKDAIDNHYLIDADPGFRLNEQHPKIKKLIKVIEDLSNYIDNEAPAELHEQYENKHEIPLSISNREFWETALDSTLSRVNA